MLNEFRVHPTLPAVDFERAKRFYGETLGFQIETENATAVIFSSAGGTRFTVFATPNPNRAGHTQAGVGCRRHRGRGFSPEGTRRRIRGVRLSKPQDREWCC